MGCYLFVLIKIQPCYQITQFRLINPVCIYHMYVDIFNSTLLQGRDISEHGSGLSVRAGAEVTTCPIFAWRLHMQKRWVSWLFLYILINTIFLSFYNTK